MLRWRCRGDVGHGMTSLLSHAGDDIVEVISLLSHTDDDVVKSC
jgi:hypothetical protein